MSLPDLAWQVLYGQLAWGIVATAVIVFLLPRRLRLGPAARLMLLAGSVALHLVPGAASPAYWLGLAFQYPSAVLTGICLARLWPARQAALPRAALPTGLAAAIVLAGAALYLEAIGLLSFGLYVAGFGPTGAPVAVVLLAAACAVAVLRGVSRAYALAVLGALTLFAVTRLPTGNLWSALLDPFLTAWAIGSLCHAGWRAARGSRLTATPTGDHAHRG